MGDPRKLKRKYETPRQLFSKERIEEEQKLMADYGLKNIREVWVAMRELKRIRREARRLIPLGERGSEERKKILTRANKLGFVKGDATLEDLLTLTICDILERRLQTRVVRNGLARTMKQSRQLITHGFISVGGSMVSVPSYIVPLDEDKMLSYYKEIDIGMTTGAREGSEEKK